jgi:hypothetical protein
MIGSGRAEDWQMPFVSPASALLSRTIVRDLRVQTFAGVGTEVSIRVCFNAMQESVDEEHIVIRWLGV